MIEMKDAPRPQTFQEAWRNLEHFISAVERLAFEMPAPNPYTPRFVQMCVEARSAFLAQASRTGDVESK